METEGILTGAQDRGEENFSDWRRGVVILARGVPCSTSTSRFLGEEYRDGLSEEG